MKTEMILEVSQNIKIYNFPMVSLQPQYYFQKSVTAVL